MSFNTALTSGNYNSLRGTSSASPSHEARVLLSLCPNTNVYTARANQVNFTKSFAQISYDGGSGTLANVRVGMTVLLSHTNDRQAAYFAGRIRKAPAVTTLYINETSAPVADDDYIFVVDDFRIWDKLGRYVSPTMYTDYDITFRQLLPRIYSLKSAYIVYTDGSDGEFSFAPSVAAATSGATISTYAWSVGDGTITVGSSSTQNITATFPPGFRWVHLTVTDSGGRVSVRHIPVWVHDSTYPPTPLDFGDLSWQASIEDGFSGSVSAFDGIDTVLDNTLVVAWLDAERYNGTLSTIVDNIALLGRLRTERSGTTLDDEGQIDASTQFDIEGPLQTLGRLEINPLEILSDATPTAWFQVADCTPWREAFLILSEFSTFHELHSINFDSADTAFADAGVTTPVGSILNAVNSIMFSIKASAQMNAAGECEIVRNALLIPTAGRSSLVTVADWAAADWMGLDHEQDMVNIVGRSLASGGSYGTTSRKVTAVNSIAPGVAQDYPESSTSLDRQVLAANQGKKAAAAELNIRNGHWLARAQGQDTLVVHHPDGYWWLTPAQNQWYSITLDGSETARGIVLTTATRWLLAEVSVSYDVEAGTFDVQSTYKIETSGASGQTIVYPPQTSKPITLPIFPPLPAFPKFDLGDFFLPDVIDDDISPPGLGGTIAAGLRHDGNTVITWTSAGIWICNDFLTRLTPTWIEITPPLASGEGIVSCRFADDGSPGVIVSTTLIIPTSSECGTCDWEYEFDFTESSWGFVANVHPVYGHIYGEWVAGSGWESTVFTGYPQGPKAILGIVRVFPVGTLTFVRASWTIEENDPDHNVQHTVVFLGAFGDLVTATGHAPGSFDQTWTGTAGLDHDMQIIGEPNYQDNVLEDGRVIIRKLIIGGTGSNPFGGVNGRVWRSSSPAEPDSWEAGEIILSAPRLMRIGATYDDIYLVADLNNAYYSDDRGATFGDAISGGTVPEADGGFDTQRIGNVSLIAAENKARIATTQGGAYSDYTDVPTDTVATAIYIPRYKFAGTNNGSGISAPDFLFGSETPAAGTGYSLFAVTAGGVTVTNITPVDGSSNKGLAVGPNCLHIPWYSTAYQDILCVLGFGGSRKLAVSTDSGASWEITGALDASAAFVTTRRTDTARKQLFLTNGPNLAYCSDYKVTPLPLAVRIGPASANLLGVDVLP